MDPLSTPGGRNWAYFRSTGSDFRDTGRFWKLPYLGMKPGICKKGQKLHMDPLSTPGGRNRAYFRSTGSGFQDTGRFLKLPYLGMKPGIWKSARSCMLTLFPPQGIEIELIFTLWAAVSNILTDIPNCHIWAWNLEFEKKCLMLQIETLSIPGGRNWAYIRSTGSGFGDGAILHLN